MPLERSARMIIHLASAVSYTHLDVYKRQPGHEGSGDHHEEDRPRDRGGSFTDERLPEDRGVGSSEAVAPTLHTESDDAHETLLRVVRTGWPHRLKPVRSGTCCEAKEGAAKQGGDLSLIHI